MEFNLNNRNDTNIKKDTSEIKSYDHSHCEYCNCELKRPYDIIQEIKNVLNGHPVPLSVREIQKYLGNASYDSLNYYIKIDLGHLDKILEDLTEVEIIKYQEDGHIYYMTRTNINKQSEKRKRSKD